MSKGASKPDFFDWVVAHPRNALQLGFSVLVGIWQLPVMLVEVLLHVVLVRWLRIPWWWVLLGGMGVAVVALWGNRVHTAFSGAVGDVYSGVGSEELGIAASVFVSGLGGSVSLYLRCIVAAGVRFFVVGGGYLGAVGFDPEFAT